MLAPAGAPQAGGTHPGVSRPSSNAAGLPALTSKNSASTPTELVVGLTRVHRLIRPIVESSNKLSSELGSHRLDSGACLARGGQWDEAARLASAVSWGVCRSIVG